MHKQFEKWKEHRKSKKMKARFLSAYMGTDKLARVLMPLQVGLKRYEI